MGLLSIIAVLMAGVGFITFGFTQTVCGTPATRFRTGTVGNSSVIIHGWDYDFSKFNHPNTGSFDNNTNPLFEGNWNVAGADISFMFQKTGGSCRNIITRADNSSITTSNNDLQWYFPCNVFNQFGTSGVNLTGYDSNTTCHVSSTAHQQLDNMRPEGQVYYTWDDVKSTSRNLAIYERYVTFYFYLGYISRSHTPPSAATYWTSAC